MEPNWIKIDKTMSFTKANVYSTLLMVPILLILVGPYILLQGTLSLWDAFQSMLGNFPLLILVFIFGIIAHEWLHGTTWIIVGNLPQGSVTYGVKWAIMTPYAHLIVPVPIETYRWGGLMPGIILGFIPGIIGMIVGIGELFIFGVIFSLAATGDIMIWLLLRDAHPKSLVEDHPDRIGCYLLIDEKLLKNESETSYE